MKFSFLLVSLLLPALSSLASESHPFTLNLHEHWAIQDSKKIDQSPEKISQNNFPTDQWMSAEIPTTVLGTILKHHPEFDPNFGKNLRKLPGTYGKVGENFADVEMPKDSPFAHAWWFRTQFRLPRNFQDKQIDLHLQGVNYSAEVWLNGKKIAGEDSIEGMYRTYSLPVTKDLAFQKENTLAVKIIPPHPHSLVPNWADWNPTPQDKNLGLWREVYLSAEESIAIQHPQVMTHFDLPSTEVAHLTVEANLMNPSKVSVKGKLSGKIEDVYFSQSVELAPGETRAITFSPADFPQLNFNHPRLWWPKQMGKPELYRLQLKFTRSERHEQILSDETITHFGIREITSELLQGKYRLFKVNGKAILIRGGGWSGDLFLRFSKERMEKEMRYVQHLNLNTIRLEGTMQPEYFYDLTDRFGILVMPGWVCCNYWQESAKWNAHTKIIAKYSMHDQLMELRSHASVFTFLYGSDEIPSEEMEKIYLAQVKETHFSNPVLAAAAGRISKISGNTGVKMWGPYNYVGPSYWLTAKPDTQVGGAWGFDTETSPGVAIPTLESLKKFLPADHLWPIDAEWNYHAGGGDFTNINLFTKALSLRYGSPLNLEEFEIKSQVMAYDGERAMFEAYGRIKYHSATGVVQWMLNNAWPSLIWHLYDYYLDAGGGFYGVKKANEPLHLQYSYDDRSIALVNSTYESKKNLQAQIQVFDFDLHPLFDQTIKVNEIAADGSERILQIPAFKNNTKTYFVKLLLQDENGKALSHNFYWLSTQSEIYDWKKTQYTNTPLKQEADLRLLGSLPPVHLQVKSSIDESKHRGVVTIRNPSNHLAFSIRLKLVEKTSGELVLPILWQDNYVSLLPGETREIQVKYPQAQANGRVEVKVDGWNIQ